MAFLNKLRRTVYLRNGKALFMYVLLIIIVIYLIITTLFVHHQYGVKPKTTGIYKEEEEEVEEKTQHHKRKRKSENIDLPLKGEVDDELLADTRLIQEFLDVTPSEPTIIKQKLPCNPPGIKPKSATTKPENISCIPHKASDEACEFADMLYARDDKLKSCGSLSQQRRVEICKVIEIKNGAFTYKCSLIDCQQFNRKKVTVLKFDPTTHEVVQHNTHSKAEDLESDVMNIASRSSTSGYNFLFLECTVDETIENEQTISQLLILPPRFRKRRKVKLKRPLLNVNLVLLDSVSRSHFYRSLPSTVETLTRMNGNDSRAEVLDFRLFQSVEGHTAENLHALFTGTLFPKSFSGSDRENAEVGIRDFFQNFSRDGYNTFYQDDLCFDEWWGLRLDLGAPTTWSDFEESLRNNCIDHTGLSFSSCRILKHNNVTNPFNGPDGPLCFNGRFQNSYQLDLVQFYHEYASRHRIKLLSYTELNVGHDHTGRRIQSIDNELSAFMKNMSNLDNTLTVLFADHGNTYTHYTHAIMEGQFEQYHPTLFIILPDQVKKIIGDNILNNLRANQNKLVTILDVHDALAPLHDKPVPRGIFGPIRNDRNCNDLDLRLPNFCVCEGWDAETFNDTAQVGVLDFAIGEINNRIVEKQEELRANKQMPNCKRLIPLGFTNVRQRNVEGKLLTSLDFRTAAGEGAPQTHDVFHVEVEQTINPEIQSHDMKLLSLDRLSRYGPYSVCLDKGVDKRICVCNIKSNQHFETLPASILREIIMKPQLVTTDLIVQHSNKVSNCLYIRTISYPELTENQEEENIFSCSYEVANLCEYPVNIRLIVSLDNMKSSGSIPIEKEVFAYSIVYVGSMIRSTPYWSSKVESAHFEIVKETQPIEEEDSDLIKSDDPVTMPKDFIDDNSIQNV